MKSFANHFLRLKTWKSGGVESSAPPEELASDRVIVTVVKVSTVTPNGTDAIKVLIETDAAMDALVGGERYSTPAQTEDRKVKITATITPAMKDVPVYFEVIDPDDLSSYEGKELGDGTTGKPDRNAVYGSENRTANDNRDPARKISVASDYTAFQGCLSARNQKTDADGKAEIVLTVTDQYSGDNYIVRAACMNPVGKPFDKYSLAPLHTPTTPVFPAPLTVQDRTKILESLQYEPKTNIAQSALLVAWKRTYIEHAEMYKKGATVTSDALAGATILFVDNTADFSTNDDVTIFLPKNGTNSFDRKVVAKTATTITLDANHPRDIPQYAGVKLKNDDEVYSNDTSYLVKAFGYDASGIDGGAFIEFKSLAANKIPKYAEFPDDDEMFKDGTAWFIHAGIRNTMLLVAAKKHQDGSLGTTDYLLKQAFITIDSCLANAVNCQRNTTTHEIGHIWSLRTATVPHVHGRGRKPHDNNDECVMSYGRDRNNNSPEFCLDCLRWLLNFKNF